MKNFEVGSVHKPSDYQSSLGGLGFIAALCIGIIVFFVCKLAGAI
jgi:hypothetical protein